jgi:hypothetical protein
MHLCPTVRVHLLPWHVHQSQESEWFVHHFSLTQSAHTLGSCVELHFPSGKALQASSGPMLTFQDKNLPVLLGHGQCHLQASQTTAYHHYVSVGLQFFCISAF